MYCSATQGRSGQIVVAGEDLGVEVIITATHRDQQVDPILEHPAGLAAGLLVDRRQFLDYRIDRIEASQPMNPRKR